MPYVRAADEIARSDIWHLDTSKDRLELLEEMVVGQVVFGQLLTILRRLGEEHYSAERFGARHGSGGGADLTGTVSRPATSTGSERGRRLRATASLTPCMKSRGAADGALPATRLRRGAPTGRRGPA